MNNQLNKTKSMLHSRNKHHGNYDFNLLTHSNKDLGSFVIKNKLEENTIDFSNANAVLELNKALLKMHYGINYWDIPPDYLCPPIPGRADYIHYAADLLLDKLQQNANIKCLDIGAGANCIYPILGVSEYDWDFVATDIDLLAIHNAEKIVRKNPILNDKITIRHQKNNRDIFHNIIKNKEFFDLSICNPPFHDSFQMANKANLRKNKNLNIKTEKALNFGGKPNELICDGGEVRFIRNMIYQSKKYAKSCFWFSCLVSKKEHLKDLYKTLRKVNCTEFKTIKMQQGNKKSRFIAWTFFERKSN